MAATPVYTNDGGASITQGAGTNVLVNQTETIISWSNFNTAGGELVNFEQGALSGSSVLNRISGLKTQFDGDLQSASDMSIFLLNPAGIVFGGGSSVNVGALVASSFNLSDPDFLSGVLNFTGGASAGSVENHGTINADTIALIGKTVLNTGAINGDFVIMAAGDTVNITGDFELGNVVVEVLMPVQMPGDYDYWVDHGDAGSGNGSINGEQVILAAGDIWSSAYIDASADGTARVALNAKGGINIDGGINVYVEAGSDAVAQIEIIAGGDIEVDNGIYAYAYNGSGDPSFNATAQIEIDAGGKRGYLFQR